MVADDIALGGDWYKGDTGSDLSAVNGGCNVFRVGKEWTLGVCMLLGPEIELLGDVCKDWIGWLSCCGLLYSIGLYGGIIWLAAGYCCGD